MSHLNKMAEEGRRGKVGLVTPTRQLTFQQKGVLESDIAGICAVEITGTSKTPIDLLIKRDEVHVIVCTSGKLRRELRTKAASITDFSLIIFDECHHAGRPYSSYSEIMEFYIKQKRLPAIPQLPQIIGLTASPGAGKGRPNEENVMEHLRNLCSVLDATSGFKVVEENVVELNHFRNDPATYLEAREERPPDDQFVAYLYDAMEALEQRISNVPSLARGSSKYDTWLQNEKEAAESREVDERERISVLDQLSVYSQALITYKDFRYEDAIACLEQITQFSNPTPFEQEMSRTHKELMDKLSQLNITPNPLLQRMQQIIEDQFARCPESKGIFFVRAIKHTKFITDWIKSSPSLSKVRPSPITGHSRGGMEKLEQVRVLDAFRKGTYNLLASTSVLEEGLDVPECNFVIRYQNISNEIAQVQAKGRARAEDSRMYTVISTKSNKQYWYHMQEEKQHLVNSLVKKVESTTVDLTQRQSFFLDKKQQRLLQMNALRSRWPDTDKVEILCKKCKCLVCKGSELFYHNDGEFHYVVPDKAFSSKYEKAKHDKPESSDDFVKPYRMICLKKGCRNKWGVIAIWSDTGYQFPLLKCESFLFRYGSETQRFKKWKSIWFDVQNILEWDDFEDKEFEQEQTVSA